MEEEVYQALYKLRDFLYENIYFSEVVSRELEKAKGIVQAPFDHYTQRPYEIPNYKVYLELWGEYDPVQAAVDYVAGMTDRFAVKKFSEIFVPKGWAIL